MIAPTIGMKQCAIFALLVFLLSGFTTSSAFANSDSGDINTSSVVDVESALDLTDGDNDTDNQEAIADIIEPLPKLTAAEQLRMQRRLDSQVQFCSPCHGVNGVARQALYPDLAGKSQQYLMDKLISYKQKNSANKIMQGMVAPLNEEDLLALSQYYAEQMPVHNQLLAAESPAKQDDSALQSETYIGNDNEEEINP
ncbi:c-type cytochrome [Thalassotalea sp. PS06]|uniref:c-type cytochrome n=1 Tax=Thalassotalea sp. PS06 TaxID=2594005 RepID=UPI0011647BDE|nr:hypothetical protein [Thalassotalea sp. PS06]QDP02628.1 hypothetical protein FNC98_15510 [Thalassotalea sp. PS06]